MRFVPVTTIEQQAELFVHCARQGYVEERTAQINRMRGLLSELGIVLPMKAAAMRREAHLATYLISKSRPNSAAAATTPMVILPTGPMRSTLPAGGGSGRERRGL